ncbi:hypothetical protein ACOMHN_032174 [Nucella lapillus]
MGITQSEDKKTAAADQVSVTTDMSYDDFADVVPTNDDVYTELDVTDISPPNCYSSLVEVVTSNSLGEVVTSNYLGEAVTSQESTETYNDVISDVDKDPESSVTKPGAWFHDLEHPLRSESSCLDNPGFLNNPYENVDNEHVLQLQHESEHGIYENTV